MSTSVRTLKLTAELISALPLGMQAAAIDGHLYVWRPALLSVSIEEAHQLSVAHKNGILLGYEVPSMNPPGEKMAVVLLFDESGENIGGFHTHPENASRLGAKFAQDYLDARDERISYTVTYP